MFLIKTLFLGLIAIPIVLIFCCKNLLHWKNIKKGLIAYEILCATHVLIWQLFLFKMIKRGDGWCFYFFEIPNGFWNNSLCYCLGQWIPFFVFCMSLAQKSVFDKKKWIIMLFLLWIYHQTVLIHWEIIISEFLGAC